MNRRHLGLWALSLGSLSLACVVPPGDVGALTGDATDTTQGATSSGGSADESEGSDGPGDAPSPACGPDGPACLEDQDGDCVGQGEDNAPDVHNPDQADLDADGLADAIDACPSVVSPGVPQDADGDGLGDECDPCRRAAEAYAGASHDLQGYMRIRNVPSATDTDGDGIGDACDNCIHVPNCEGYGPASPWQPGDPIADGDDALCQTDADGDFIGDACQGLPPLSGAAGPIGVGPYDDFDQDGLPNVLDACARAPLTDAIVCTTDDDCPAARKCETAVGRCDHVDTDGDAVGDDCDSCVWAENPLQVADGAMADGDDDDGDARSNNCETSPACTTAPDPSRIAFYPVSAGGWCCTTAYPGDDVLFDPDGVPLRLECSAEQEAAQQCRRVPAEIVATPGFVSLPAGCEPALADAGLTVETNLPLAAADVGGLEGLWPYACKLPPLDQDLDALGDACDLCPLAFDPQNQPYVDEEGTLWPEDGKYCSGAYSPESVCMGG